MRRGTPIAICSVEAGAPPARPSARPRRARHDALHRSRDRAGHAGDSGPPGRSLTTIRTKLVRLLERRGSAAPGRRRRERCGGSRWASTVNVDAGDAGRVGDLRHLPRRAAAVRRVGHGAELRPRLAAERRRGGLAPLLRQAAGNGPTKAGSGSRTSPWGWAAYHYGRWTYDPAYSWVWVPGYQWAPAWVTWRYSPEYIGCSAAGSGHSPSSSTIYPVHYRWWSFVPCQPLRQGSVRSVAFARQPRAGASSTPPSRRRRGPWSMAPTLQPGAASAPVRRAQHRAPDRAGAAAAGGLSLWDARSRPGRGGADLPAQASTRGSRAHARCRAAHQSTTRRSRKGASRDARPAAARWPGPGGAAQGGDCAGSCASLRPAAPAAAEYAPAARQAYAPQVAPRQVPLQAQRSYAPQQGSDRGTPRPPEARRAPAAGAARRARIGRLTGSSAAPSVKAGGSRPDPTPVYVCVTRMVVFIRLPVSRSLALTVRMPSTFTS